MVSLFSPCIQVIRHYADVRHHATQESVHTTKRSTNTFVCVHLEWLETNVKQVRRRVLQRFSNLNKPLLITSQPTVFPTLTLLLPAHFFLTINQKTKTAYFMKKKSFSVKRHTWWYHKSCFPIMVLGTRKHFNFSTFPFAFSVYSHFSDIDECTTGQHNCDVPQRVICNNTHGSFLCHCRHGYCGEDGLHCKGKLYKHFGTASCVQN